MSDTRSAHSDVEAIHRLYEKWFGAMERGDVSGVLDSLADDFVLKSPSRPAVSSRAVLRRGLDESYAAYTERVRYKIEEVEVLGDQAWARVSEETTLVAKKGGKEYSISGMHLAILARQPDGSWKVKREVSSLDHE
jgi:uncharacterized protein (TIGR02246 family)